MYGRTPSLVQDSFETNRWSPVGPAIGRHRCEQRLSTANYLAQSLLATIVHRLCSFVIYSPDYHSLLCPED